VDVKHLMLLLLQMMMMMMAVVVVVVCWISQNEADRPAWTAQDPASKAQRCGTQNQLTVCD